ncbi:hypothetical protein BC834DRAFT_351352 [Gloeopeniophorella convolvens]|nr:hypothetical protein BC834DRAFT_351352 [Gloeopeniophorella convolvens]
MSLIRRNDRRAARNQLSSPYKRPSAQPKKSSWSLSSLFGFLNPLRRSESSEDLEEDVPQGDAENNDKSVSDSVSEAPHPGEMLSQRGHELTHQPPLLPSTPLRVLHPAASTSQGSGLPSESAGPSTPFNLPTIPESPGPGPSQSPAEKLETVKKYLQDRADHPLHHVEYLGLVTLLKDSVQDEDSQPFRFSASPAPSRDATPAFNMGSPPSLQTPRRTLSRNPNGIYKWQGAGSARPRNRHQSPAFGPPRATPSRIKLSAPEPSPKKTDTKRRRVETDAGSATPHEIGGLVPSTPPRGQARGDPSATRTPNGSSSSHTSNGDANSNKSSAVPATPKLRLSVPPNPTTPAVPSPLRNTWGVSDSSSPPQASPPSKPSQPTRAANFMAELIKEVTPPKKPDLSNPYQTASPVKPSLQKKPAKKRKANEERPKEPEKEAVLSPQTIIEATVPIGSKRSRPPPNIGKTPTSKSNGVLQPEPLRRSSRFKSPSPPRVNGIHAATTKQDGERAPDDDTPSPKKQKKTPATTVEDVPDVDMDSPGPSPVNSRPSDIFDSSDSQSASKKQATSNGVLFNGAAKSSFPLKSSAPKEPSKLRFGFAAESDPVSPPAAKSAFSAPSASAQPFQSSNPPPAPRLSPVPTPSPTPPIERESFTPPPAPKLSNAVLSSSIRDLPSVPDSSTPPPAPKLSNTTLSASPFAASSPAPARAPTGPKEAALALNVASLPTFAFNLPTIPQAALGHALERSAASAASPLSLPNFSFTFNAEPGPSSGFNWVAAGMKPPTKPSGSWACGVCMINNDASKTKCASCEEPRPASTTNGTAGVAVAQPPLNPPAPSGGFNWAAAGMKVPTKATGTWTCGVCMVDNDPAKTKCASCEEPRPNAGPSAPVVQPLLNPPTAPTGGFNWAAAGMKAPTKAAGTWTCSTCMVPNDAAKTKCVSCETPKS